MSNPFEGIIRRDNVPSRNEWAMDLLEKLLEAIDRGTGGEVRARLEPGFTTGAGQEWKLIVEPRVKGFPKLLLRASVGLPDQPVRLEFAGGQSAVVDSREAMELQIKAFMNLQQTQNLFDTLIKINDPRYLAGLMDREGSGGE